MSNMPNFAAMSESSLSITPEDVQEFANRRVYASEDEDLFANPPKEIQEWFVGGSFESTYNEASRFLNWMMARTFDPLPLRTLDFGCGWGRMLRLLRKMPALEGVEMHGCDTQEAPMEAVRRSVSRVYMTPCGPLPPSRYNGATFDVIYAYSVFSHLSEEAHLAWAGEFARILKPGGRVCVTTQGLRMLQVCADYREGRRPITHPWHRDLASSFAEPGLEEKYQAGGFLFSATQPHNPTYGESLVPRAYFERHWGEHGFEVTDWDESFPQVHCVMKLRA